MTVQQSFAHMRQDVHAPRSSLYTSIWPLADLTGSEKQVKWALTIRQEKVVAACSREEFNLIRSIDSAAFLIANRNLTTTELAKKYLNVLFDF